MHYLGGKSKTARDLGVFLNSAMFGRTDYYEPFVGAAWVTCQVRAKNRFASDVHSDLIAMYLALQQGWEPPEYVSEEDYSAARTAEPHLRAFIGFGCSFGGKWFGGFSRDNRGRSYAAACASSLRRKMKYLQDVRFRHLNYRNLQCKNAVIYCDPPYKGTTGYKIEFCHVTFWNWVRRMSKTNLVFVSEYQAPSDFECVLALETETNLSQLPRVERLFKLRD